MERTDWFYTDNADLDSQELINLSTGVAIRCSYDRMNGNTISIDCYSIDGKGERFICSAENDEDAENTMIYLANKLGATFRSKMYDSLDKKLKSKGGRS